MDVVNTMPEIAAKGTRQKPSQRFSPVAGLAPASNVDRMLAASGVAIACSTLAFAGYMVADSDRPPRIAGMEYLSIFARPSHRAGGDGAARGARRDGSVEPAGGPG